MQFEDLSKLTGAQIDEVFPPTSGIKVEGEYYMIDFVQPKKEHAKPAYHYSFLGRVFRLVRFVRVTKAIDSVSRSGMSEKNAVYDGKVIN